MNDIITVVVVSLNEREEKIKKTLNSIFNQTFPDTEVIIIDGGSAPETLHILKQYYSKFASYISEPDNGIYDAMNKGIAASHGEWLIFMNMGDEFSDTTSIERMIQESKQKDEIIYGDFIYKEIGFMRSIKKINKWTLYSSSICHQTVMSRRSVFDKIGQFNTSIGIAGDPDWILRAYSKGCEFRHLGQLVCIYEGGGYSSNFERQQKARSWLLNKHFSLTERLIFGFIFCIVKIWRRLITGNFAIPVGYRFNKL